MAKKSQDYIVYLKANNADLKRKLADTRSRLKKHNSVMSNLSKQAAGYIGGFFAVSGAISLGRDIIDITGKFQKFSAVLSNTLGSGSAAKAALDDIKEFAAKTPFQVDELTESYIKLANQGFVPTMMQMTRLGDLASSTGKSFDQLAEAIIDAQVGEFERLKEFGVRASKQGDQVKFTFKGVETQVKFTDKAIREYLLSLGQVEGVSGSMAAISETLEGKLSNLQDNFDQLKLKIGEMVAGPLSNAITGLNDFLAALQNIDLVVTALGKDLEDFSKSEIFRLVDAGMITESGKRVRDLIQQFKDMPKNADVEGTKRKFFELFKSQGEGLEDITILWNTFFTEIFPQIDSMPSRFDMISKAVVKGGEKQKNTLGSLKEKLKDLQKQQAETNVENLAGINDQIKAVQELINKYEELTNRPAPSGKSDAKSKEAEPISDPIKMFSQKTLNEMFSERQFKKAEIDKKIQAGFDAPRKALRDEIDALNAILESGLVDGLASFADGLASGGLDGAFKGLFEVIGNGLQTLGKSLIAFGVSMEAFKKAFTNPYAAIAAGTAAIIAGALVKNAASNIVTSTSGGGASSGGGRGGFVSPSRQSVKVELKGKASVSMRELSFALEDYRSKDSRITGG